MIKAANYNIIGKVIMISCLIFTQALYGCHAQTTEATKSIIPAAHQINDYLPLLKDKRVGLVVNQTSIVGSVHLVDTLKSLGVAIKTVFAPEHGFRGDADAGASVESGFDTKTKLPIISLYGTNKKMLPQQLENIDVVIFDIQDVGTRFYTYISTMHYVMEACAENSKRLIILDRPNPNGMYVDGPILEMKHQSFVGMHPIPILHGLTVGELALMINGEKWLKNELTCEVTVIPVKNYQHQMPYSLPVQPSPNLPNDLSIALYPSLCLFEGTVISVGRGTEFPFQQIGHPELKKYPHTFTPVSMPGSSTHPPYKDEKCYGLLLESKTYESGLSLVYLIEFYEAFPDKTAFFNNFFVKLAGTMQLQKQIESGFTEEEIKLSWQNELESYKAIREKYLLYE
ncbi:DUF1343 domain-containing protein [Marivirga sp. S37H4]|uniref:DUF1343 domain-containing protein n=1 Tax=Marivirga aurantiaca TaxID=2802615 RepID=A0A934WXW3_9BACT|nr:DUF1343 domain-containing protein [Marivirga aurantiaca]MBK6265188.1 DUF1343 domain-containing protein [Marivirga aurantiaca]